MHLIEWDQFLDQGLDDFFPKDKIFSAMTIGVFDGVHRGHQMLIERIVRHDTRALPVIITFSPFRSKTGCSGCIISQNQKLSLLENAGAAVTVVAGLTETFKRMSGEFFLDRLRESGRMGFLAIGSNFRCGHHQSADASAVKKINEAKNIPTEIIKVMTEDNIPISSSRIRDAVASGNLKTACSMLGRPYILDIRDSDKSGSTVHPAQILPPQGKYNVLLHGQNIKNIKSQIEITGGRIELKERFDIEFIEFIN